MASREHGYQSEPSGLGKRARDASGAESTGQASSNPPPPPPPTARNAQHTTEATSSERPTRTPVVGSGIVWLGGANIDVTSASAKEARAARFKACAPSGPVIAPTPAAKPLPTPAAAPATAKIDLRGKLSRPLPSEASGGDLRAHLKQRGTTSPDQRPFTQSRKRGAPGAASNGNSSNVNDEKQPDDLRSKLSKGKGRG